MKTVGKKLGEHNYGRHWDHFAEENDALELGGIEFVGDHDWRDRTDGVRFAKDRPGKLRRDIVEEVSRWLDVVLRMKTEKNLDFFERTNEEIVEAIVSEMREGIHQSVKMKLNRI